MPNGVKEADLTKAESRAFFLALRQRKPDLVKRLIKDHRLINCCAFAPPKKDDGQSPLQIAIKTGQFDVASLLIDKGADVNFREKSKINKWNIPVLHDCIRAAMFESGSSRFRDALKVLKKLLRRGADPNKLDPAGNNSLVRAALDARQRLNPVFEKIPKYTNDIATVFRVLRAGGANPDSRRSRQGLFRGTYVQKFLE